jgi:hypothetical protein
VGILNDYQMLQVRQQDDPHLYISTGASAATASGRIAYFLGLQGPAGLASIRPVPARWSPCIRRSSACRRENAR